MRLLFPTLVLVLFAAARAAEDSCEGRCEDGFDAQRKCQCDTLCVYYQSCCSDYSTVCKAKVTRGDVFALPEDDYLDYNFNVDLVTEAAPPELPTSLPPAEPTLESNPGPEETLPAEEVLSTTPGLVWNRDPVEKPEELCSRKPFDAFTDLKNGSFYAFRGKYFYELDETSVRPGYPKLISDIWGIEGPIDAAFTRINCQGKTYLFKGGQYWRFDDGALDPGYPRNISEGFEGIPDNIDAAFALPAHSYHGNERVYFFKDKYYWSYDFAQQPTQADCEKSSPSAVFNHYAFMNRDSWEDVFQILFGGRRIPDKYYRVNLRTKRVDVVQPRYPRSIAQYWLDCPQPGEEST
ncbi:PREDICTED: vitronectin-like [Apaloderma vittatum]|uniref:vitronectin-like n=1 Tax=Apaloderma vittatum TaxID=57397 RepID=UPI0005213D34|nr:PREDICTED: vitronectin-like [Apaloderma vittatum]